MLLFKRPASRLRITFLFARSELVSGAAIPFRGLATGRTFIMSIATQHYYRFVYLETQVPKSPKRLSVVLFFLFVSDHVIASVTLGKTLLTADNPPGIRS